MRIWLMQDPETDRIALQDREPGEESFPAGRRGAGWEVRVSELDDDVMTDLLAARLSPIEQTLLHRQLWAEAAT
jgi:hypothetical protein